MSGERRSTLLVRVKNVVLRLHSRMARVSAVRRAGVGAELVRRRIVVEQRVSPSAAFGKSVAVLFHDESLLENVRHINDEGGLGALLRLSLELHDLGAVRERLAVPGDARLVRMNMGGLATITLSTSSVRAEETTDQS